MTPPAPKPPDGALDRLLGPLSLAPTFDEATREAARAELAALRQRVADLEMMLRRSLPNVQIARTIHTNPVLGPKPASWVLRILGTNERFPLTDDGTGLPLLTDEARAALAQPERR